MQGRLPPEVNRILYVRNLPYNITGEELYDVFGKYGAIRQIRMCVAAPVAAVASCPRAPPPPRGGDALPPRGEPPRRVRARLTD